MLVNSTPFGLDSGHGIADLLQIVEGKGPKALGRSCARTARMAPVVVAPLLSIWRFLHAPLLLVLICCILHTIFAVLRMLGLNHHFSCGSERSDSFLFCV